MDQCRNICFVISLMLFLVSAPLPFIAANTNDPPLPSYSALMASEQHGMTQSPQDLGSHPAFASHRRTPSFEQTPYAPVDYGLLISSHAHYGQDGCASQSTNSHRLSDGSLSRRPLSDPNGIDFSQLSLTAGSSSPPNPPRHQTAPILQNYPAPNMYPARQRAVTADYAYEDSNGAASVYSLDSGIGAYTAGNSAYHQSKPASGYDPYMTEGGFAQQGEVPNPYYSAANEFLGLPPGVAQASSSTDTSYAPTDDDSASS